MKSIRITQNNKKYILPTIILCFVLFTMKAFAADVYFDADAVRRKTASKSSLMDVNGVFVFRDEFIEREQIVKQAEKQKLENLEYSVLISAGQNRSYAEIVNLVLMSDTDKYIGEVYNVRAAGNLRWWVYCSTAGICLLCFAIRIQDIWKNKKETKHKEDIYGGIYNDI